VTNAIPPSPTRSAKNTVAPAKAGAYDVCLARPTGEIGPSLRWGDGGSRSGCHKAPPLQGRGGMYDSLMWRRCGGSYLVYVYMHICRMAVVVKRLTLNTK